MRVSCVGNLASAKGAGQKGKNSLRGRLGAGRTSDERNRGGGETLDNHLSSAASTLKEGLDKGWKNVSVYQMEKQL